MFMLKYRNILKINAFYPYHCILRNSSSNTLFSSLLSSSLKEEKGTTPSSAQNTNQKITNDNKSEHKSEHKSGYSEEEQYRDYHVGNIRPFDKIAIRKICEEEIKIKIHKLMIYRDYIKHTNILRVPYGTIDLTNVAKIYRIEYDDISEQLTKAVRDHFMDNDDINNKMTVNTNLHMTDNKHYVYGNIDFLLGWGAFHRSVISVMSNKLLNNNNDKMKKHTMYYAMTVITNTITVFMDSLALVFRSLGGI